MKKVALMALLAVGSVALAASLNVPWFVDTMHTAVGLPPSEGITTLVALHNNLSEEITCQINYFAADGMALTGADETTRGNVWTATYNTFAIDGNATIQFRPVADDAVTAGGQESATGVLVPNRPKYTGSSFSNKNNGSLVVSWGIGGENGADGNAVQGKVTEYSPTYMGMHLLPPGS